MSLLLLLTAIALFVWTVASVAINYSPHPYSDRVENAKTSLIGYAIIIGGFLLLGVLILLGKAGLVIFVALLVAALVTFIVKLIKIARS